MKKSIWICGGLTASAAAAAGFYTSVRLLVNTALDRRAPGWMKWMGRKIAGEPEVEPAFQRELEEKAQELAGRDHEIVETAAYDGIRLMGHWFGKTGARRVIIGMHGWRSDWFRDFGMVMDAWLAEGCSVLLPEQRGQSQSGGAYMGFGLTERFDCLSWVRWVTRRCGNLPIYLGGVSMGAATVLMAAGLGLPANVRGIIADCGFTSPQAIWQHVARRNLHISFGLRRAAVNRLCRRKIRMGAGDYSTTQALAGSSLPVLLIHGTADRFVPVEMTYENYLACAGPRRLLIVPGAGHGMSYFCEREVYEQTVRDFWRDFDGKPEETSS